MSKTINRLIYYILFLFLITLIIVQPEIATSSNNDKMVFLGDSNTASVQWPNGSYVEKLNLFGEPWQSDLNLINSGVDGTGIFTYYQKPNLIHEMILNYHPRFIFIALGGNDYLRFFNWVKFEEEYNYLLDYLTSKQEICGIQKIYLANIYWGAVDFPEEFEIAYLDHQGVIANMSKKYDLEVIDFFETTFERPEYYLSDGIHLNETGHVAIAKQIDTQIGTQIIDDQKINLDSNQIDLTECDKINEPTDNNTTNNSDFYWSFGIIAIFTLAKYNKNK